MMTSENGKYKATIMSVAENHTNNYDMALDYTNLKIYWTDPGRVSLKDGRLHRCNFDGSNFETVYSKLSYPTAIFIDYVENKLYFAEGFNGQIHEIELSGFDGVTKFPIKLSETDGRKTYNVARDIEIGYINGLPAIGVHTFITTIDVDGDWIYFVDAKQKSIQKVLRHGEGSQISDDGYRLLEKWLLRP